MKGAAHFVNSNCQMGTPCPCAAPDIFLSSCGTEFGLMKLSGGGKLFLNLSRDIEGETPVTAASHYLEKTAT